MENNEYQRMTVENAKAIAELVVLQKNTQEDIKQIVSNYSKHELEKSAMRLDGLEKKMKTLSPVLTICYYPRITVLGFLAISALYISDIRQPLLKMLGF